MKHLSVLILSACLILLNSCSGDDSSTPGANALVGKWALQKVSTTANGFTSPEEDYINSDPGCEDNDFMQFLADGTAQNGYYDPNCAVSLSEAVWSLSGSQLTIDYTSEDDAVFEVISVTGNILKIRTNLSGGEGTEPGVELYVNFTLLKAN